MKANRGCTDIVTYRDALDLDLVDTLRPMVLRLHLNQRLIETEPKVYVLIIIQRVSVEMNGTKLECKR